MNDADSSIDRTRLDSVAAGDMLIMRLIPSIFQPRGAITNSSSNVEESNQANEARIDEVETRFLDINSDSVLSDWGVKHALREIIANALDETELSAASEPIQLYFEGGFVVIRDFGRGIQERHFVQNESLEKKESSTVIGKYGAGLKDAIAVLHKNGVGIEIKSSFIQVLGVDLIPKYGSSVKSLHLLVDESDESMIGTEVALTGITEEELEEAKEMFLHFREYTPLARTAYGDILSSGQDSQTIYYKGLVIAEVSGFSFSYNITKEDSHLRKNLNRDRMNVGRAAWTNSVKSILKNCEDERILSALEENVNKKFEEEAPEELKWKDILTLIYARIGSKEQVVFLPASKAVNVTNDERKKAENSGRVIVVDDHIVDSLPKDQIITFNEAISVDKGEYNYERIAPQELEPWEQERLTVTAEKVVKFLKDHSYSNDSAIFVSESIHKTRDVLGTWSKKDNAIYLKRSVLRDERQLIHTLFHEFGHSQFGHKDETRAFEDDLCDFIAHLFLDQAE